ncbi:MAG: glycerophosphodiester phosphodiesterase [Nostocoides sp.]
MPLVIAHRGASAEQPEHTAASYQTALAVGADGIECDVRLSRDRHLVCIHDGRVDRTSNGHGWVSAMHRDTLDTFDWGPGETGVLTLERLLDIALASTRPLRLLIEVKHPVRPAGAVERELAAVLTRSGLIGQARPGGLQVMVMSFSAAALRRMGALSPALPLVHLVDRRPSGRRRTGRLPDGVDTVGLDVRLIAREPAIVARYRDRGHHVFAWTVNDPGQVDVCVRAGVEALITDDPRAVLGQLHRLD